MLNAFPSYPRRSRRSPPSWKQKTYKQRSEWSAVPHLVTPERFVTHTRLPYRLLYIFRCTFSLAWGQIRTAKIEIVTMSRPSFYTHKGMLYKFLRMMERLILMRPKQLSSVTAIALATAQAILLCACLRWWLNHGSGAFSSPEPRILWLYMTRVFSSSVISILKIPLNPVLLWGTRVASNQVMKMSKETNSTKSRVRYLST